MASMRRKGVAVRIIVGAGVCLYWKEVSLEPRAGAGSGLALDQPSGRGALRCRRAQSTCSVTARAAVQAGSVGQDLMLSVAFWAAEVKW